MNTNDLVASLEQAVKEAQEELRRRRAALAALKGKDSSAQTNGKPAGLRAGGVPVQAQKLLQEKGPLTAEQLATLITGKNARDISLALARYVAKGEVFSKDAEGKYDLIAV